MLVPHRWIQRGETPRTLAIPVLVGIGVAARYAQIRLGVFGYTSSYERLLEMGSLTQYLAIAASAGQIALTIAALDFYGARRRVVSGIWLAIALAFELGFGLLSGFKSLVVMPFVVVGACKYLRSGRVPWVWVVVFVIGLPLAYAVIEPFRQTRKVEGPTPATAVSEIVDLFRSSNEGGGFSAGLDEVAISVLARSSLVYVGSLGIEFRDSHEELPEGSPEFLEDLLLAPAYAFVPRVIWTSKPLGNLGLWYTQVVMERDIESATAPSPVTYLYFAGGVIAVFIGFAAFGLVHRALLVMLLLDPVPSRMLVFLGMLPTVVNIGSAVDGVVVAILRFVPILFVLQYLVYSRRRGQ